MCSRERYGTLTYCLRRESSKKKPDPLRPWNPEYDATNNCTNPHMSFSHSSVLVAEMEIPIFVWWGETKKLSKRIPEWNYAICTFTRKMERLIDLVFWSVGTDGARTRNFRLDRAVLWPIELQSQENQVYSLPNSFCSLDFIRTIWFRPVVTETRMLKSFE